MYFYLNKSIKRKIIFSVGLLSVFTLGTFAFLANKNIFTNFKPIYFQSYTYVWPYKVKSILSNSMYVSGSSISTTSASVSIPVLVYHGVSGSYIGHHEDEGTNIELKTFWEQMKMLKENGWGTITMQDFYDFKLGNKVLPPKSFLLTFDDGIKDSYYAINPILKTLGFHAVMFVIDRYSLGENSNYYLSQEELMKMANSPEWDIQSHGYSSHSDYVVSDNGEKGHFFSNKLWIPEEERLETPNEFIVRISSDLQKAKDSLEETFGKPIIAFAFPSGDYGGGTINFPNAEGTVVPKVLDIYPLAFYQYSSIYRYSQNYPRSNDTEDRFMIKRIGSASQLSAPDLLKLLESGKSKELPFVAKLDASDGWIDTTWGKMTFEKNGLSLESFPDNTGSTIILDGTNSWKDYEINAEVKWPRGSNIYLQSRYKDDNNFTACNFKKNLVHIEQIYNGDSRVIAGVENDFDPAEGSFTIGMKVSGRLVECSINGKRIVGTPFLDEALSVGGIGVKTWDSIKGNSKMIIERFSVKSI